MIVATVEVGATHLAVEEATGVVMFFHLLGTLIASGVDARDIGLVIALLQVGETTTGFLLVHDLVGAVVEWIGIQVQAVTKTIDSMHMMEVVMGIGIALTAGTDTAVDVTDTVTDIRLQGMAFQVVGMGVVIDTLRTVMARNEAVEVIGIKVAGLRVTRGVVATERDLGRMIVRAEVDANLLMRTAMLDLSVALDF